MNQNKSITIISTYFYPMVAGAEMYIFKVFSEFARRGWDIKVITTNGRPGSSNIYKPFEVVEGIKVTRKSYLSFSFGLFSLGINYNKGGIL